ncbi:MAG: hypothetical protein IIV56_04735 [Mailhella sp.]|nr:hypothetical protein [Mailhella sp.]
MKKILSLLLLAAASLGTFLALGGCAGASRSVSGDIMDDCVDGGVTRNHSYDAPKVILSTEPVALDANFFLYDEDGGGTGWTFGVRREGEVVLLSEKRRGRDVVEKPVDRAFLSEVHAVIMKHGLARLNGFDAVTSGLPYEYAPCSLSVDYASGERLYFHKDGDPEAEWARELRNLFLEAFAEQ